MDTIYRGLASATATHSLGRPDIAGADRPGAILSAIVGEALAAGLFDRQARTAPVRTGYEPARVQAASYVQREDFGAFEDEPEHGLGH